MSSKAPPAPPQRSSSSSSGSSSSILRIAPRKYAHVLDQNTNVTRLALGPMTASLMEHERIVLQPTACVVVPPRHYAIIANPVRRDDESGDVVYVDRATQHVALEYGQTRVVFESPPFPLYPGEELAQPPTKLKQIAANHALVVRVLRDFVDDDKVARRAGEIFVEKGPQTFQPRHELEVVKEMKAIIVKDGTALKLRATKAFGERKAGEEYLRTTLGAHLPRAEEEVVGLVKAHTLTERKTLHVRALASFGERRAGDVWLVEASQSPTYIAGVAEEVVREVDVTTLNSRQCCVVLNPRDAAAGRPRYGERELRKGPQQFFLQPEEELSADGIQSVVVLAEDEALLLTALEATVDASGAARRCGERWLLQGAAEYWPSVSIAIVERRRIISLDVGEGVYVRNRKTGKVTSVIGRSFMLQADQELWEKPLSPVVERLLWKQGRHDVAGELPTRDKTRVVVFKAPHNSAVQIFDVKTNASRVIFGPSSATLDAFEEFSVLDLSGGVPKKSGVIQSILLLLGPDFCTDELQVSTSDHCVLKLRLSYNWRFDIQAGKENRPFTTKDFVGDLCKAMASVVRAAVASCSFDEFHKSSAKIIRSAIFGVDEATGKVKDELFFESNGLVVSNVDVQTIEPVDEHTSASLLASVQTAISITTKAAESAALRDAERVEASKQGRLTLSKIADDLKAEEARRTLSKARAESAAVEVSGSAVAAARATAESARIAAASSLSAAETRAKAMRVRAAAELSELQGKQQLELAREQRSAEIELEKAEKMANIEMQNVVAAVEAIGVDALRDMATAGPEQKARLLKALNIESVLITDGAQPVNLFRTADGLVAKAVEQQKK